MDFKSNTPYDDLPLLPPPEDVETKAILKQCLAATRALAALKGVGHLIPDQSILINSIPLQEAQFSSEIENIVTTQDNLFRAALDESRITDPATKEVLRYRTALKAGYDAIQTHPLSVDLIRNLCCIPKLLSAATKRRLCVYAAHILHCLIYISRRIFGIKRYAFWGFNSA